MNREIICNIQFWATVASPIIGTIAIIVALWISHRSSKDAQDAFKTAQAPIMLEQREQYKAQLKELEERITLVSLDLNMADPFAGRGPLIDQIERENQKKRLRDLEQSLMKEREKIVTQISLIDAFLEK